MKSLNYWVGRFASNVGSFSALVTEIQFDARADLESLLRETEHMHLRTEENRPWLNRRNAALGWPPEK